MLESVYIDFDTENELQIHGDGSENYQITSVGGGFFGSPVPRTNRPDRSQRDGLVDLSYFYGGRVMEFGGIAYGDDITECLNAMDALKGAFRLNRGLSNDFEQIGVNQGSPQHSLVFQRNNDIYQQKCYFSQDSAFDAPMDLPNRVIPWGVTIVASDPRFYQLHVVHDEGNEDYGYGADEAEGTYLQFTLGDGDSNDFAVGGNTAALPWITLQGPWDDWAMLTLEADGYPIQTDRIKVAVADGNNVDIVTRTRLCIKNQTIRHDFINREQTNWFEFDPGVDYTLTFETSGGSDSGTEARVRWQTTRL